MEKSSWHILMIDDDEDDYCLTRSLLGLAEGRKVNLEWVPNYAAGLNCLQSKQYDAVLVDYDLGGRTGIELIREVVAAGYPAPLILYTGRGSYAVDLEAQKAGATLYLTKGEVTPLLLERSIRYAIERKHIEGELLATQTAAVHERNKLQAVMDSLPIGMAILDSQGGVSHVNAEFEQVWGGPRPIARSVDDYQAYKAWWGDSGVPVEPQEWASARAVLNGETVVGQFLQIERFDGSRAFVLNSAAPVFDGQGNVVGSSVAIMDITQFVEVERALKQSEENYRQLFYAIFDGFALHEMIYDQNGVPVDYRFLEVNPAFEKLTGLKAEELLGKTVLEVLPETEPYWIKTYGEVVCTGAPVRFENYHQSLDKYFEVIAFRPRAGQFGVIFTEITRRRKAGSVASSP